MQLNMGSQHCDWGWSREERALNPTSLEPEDL